ncbi:MAG: hypothetical protein KBD16_00500 [Candidatus Pacebacteria bacterium]|nr:hypothetical protein [Candidatus Paceibacterota bacterium]
MQKTVWWKKRISAWITYPVLVLFSVFVVGVGTFFYIPRTLQAQGWNVPFEGTITEITWNCLCNLGFMITVTPVYTQSSAANRGPVTLMFYYGGALLDALGITLTIPGTDIKIPYPKIYLWYQFYYVNGPEILGNYIPGSFQCWAYVPPYECAVEGNATGMIIGAGTGLYRAK